VVRQVLGVVAELDDLDVGVEARSAKQALDGSDQPVGQEACRRGLAQAGVDDDHRPRSHPR
jgi:hypothetical protein